MCTSESGGGGYDGERTESLEQAFDENEDGRPSTDGAEEPSHRLFAAIYDPVTAVVERRLLPPHREYLVEGLEGSVLDIGAGTGAMFPYYAEAVRDGRIELTALEPDPHMRRRATRRASDLDIPVRFSPALGESLPFPDDSFDAVVSAMVLCTVDDLDATLDEVARVLRPGGEFRLLEHVADTGWRGVLQRGLAPLWRRTAGGCRLHRETGATVEAHPMFTVVELERRRLGAFPVNPFVRGRLERRPPAIKMGSTRSLRERVERAVDRARERL